VNPTDLLPPQTRGWIFDLGNTLIVSQRDPQQVQWEGCTRVWQWLHSRGLSVPALPDFCRRLLDARQTYIEKTLQDRRQYTARQAFEETFRNLGLWEALLRLPHPEREDPVDALLQRFFEPELNAYRLDEGALPLLTFLHHRGVRLALLSNASDHRFILRILDHFNLSHFFHPIVTSAEVGYPKPDPRAFRPILDVWADLKPREIVMIGDHPEFDVLGAQQLGLKAIWIQREAPSPPSSIKPNLQVPDLQALLEFLYMPFH